MKIEPKWIESRHDNEVNRYQKGVESGELNRNERIELRERNQDYKATKAEYESDGKLSIFERVKLHHKENQASKDLYANKHDDQKAFWA